MAALTALPARDEMMHQRSRHVLLGTGVSQ